MRPITQEWLKKAEDDLRVVDAMVQDPDPPHDILCFHCQQAAEKYLKALLVERDIEFPKTHDLVEILDLIAPSPDRLARARSDLAQLSRLAVQVRYPGFTAKAETTVEARRVATLVQQVCRDELSASRA